MQVRRPRRLAAVLAGVALMSGCASGYDHGSERSYTNGDGVEVESPVYSDDRPPGATARCLDGAYSHSQSRQGTCSHHGGVAQWY